MATHEQQPTAGARSPVMKGIRRRLADIYASRLSGVFGPAGRLPNAIIIGAQKGGTTSLYRYLAQHENITASRTKEVHFFDLNYDKGETWYRYHFPLDEGERFRPALESSPYYLFHPAVPDRVHRLTPQARFIVMLRDPVARAFSHYWHEYNRGREPLSFAQALEAEEERLAGAEAALAEGRLAYHHAHHRHSYFARGLYAAQIRRWFSRFGRQQFLFVQSETFFQRPQEELDRVTDFLGVSPLRGISFKKENAGRYGTAPDSALAERLRAAYAAPNRDLAALLQTDYGWT